MPYPVVESITETSDQTNINSTTLTVNLPATINADDLLVLIISTRNGQDITNWNGFTELIDENTAITNLGSAVAYKKATGSEGSTINLTAALTVVTFAAQVYRISNWDTTQNPTARAWQNLGNTASPNPSSFSGWGWGADDNLFINMAWNSDDAATYDTFPSNFTDGSQGTVANGGANASAQVGTCYLFDNVSTTVNPTSFTLSTAQFNGNSTLAILGGAGGGGGGIAPVHHHRQLIGAV
jgi:hypothetical protein